MTKITVEGKFKIELNSNFKISEKMKKIILVHLFILLFACARGQSGVHFEQNLNWNQVLAKAKAEHKYIFVDCYATWCGPCKWMDANVYAKKEVGEAINKDFISVKLQMDRTNKDNDTIKRWYNKAKEMEVAYNIGAFPTMLFFDPDGKPVHRFTASLDVKQFLKLTVDAKNPSNQYYAVLKNFQPGKLDTAGEKGLAYSVAPTDKTLGEELALDYLTRIPRSKLSVQDNLNLMGRFKDNEQITALAIAYIIRLTKAEMAEEKNLYFLCRFSDNPDVQRIAKIYIATLDEGAFYKQPMLNFLSVFTHTPQDRSYIFFNVHTARIDTVMKNPDWAQSVISNIIFNNSVQPVLNVSHTNNMQPDFDSLKTVVSKTYGSYYASRVLTDGKIKWYGYLVNGKKDDRYWPQFAEAEMDRERKYWDKPVLTGNDAAEIDNTCYNDIFLHCSDTITINVAISWMERLLKSSPTDGDLIDTYAVLLYKKGKVDEALKLEAQVLQFWMTNRKKGTFNAMMHTTLTIQEMWKGAKIWEEKEFQ